MRFQSRLKWTVLPLALSALAFAGCSGDEPDPPDPDAVTINSFSASQMAVAPGAMVTLSYNVSNADTVSITATPGGSLLADSSELTGSVMSGAIDAMTSFELVATRGTDVKRQTVTVNVDANAVTINSFTADPNPAEAGETVTLSYNVSGATQVRILEGTNEIFNSSTNVVTGSTEVTPDLTTTYTLEASNDSAQDTETVTVTVEAPGEIFAFSATPTIYSGASADISVFWEAAGTLTLTANGVDVPAFDGTSTGTITVTITQETTFELTATGLGDTDVASITVREGVTETEPNDDMGTANPVTGAVGGNLAAGEDDWFSVTVTQGQHIRAIVTDATGGCSFDTRLELVDSTGAVIAANDDFGGTLCSGIDPNQEEGALNLDAGTYFIRLFGFDADETGDYSLTIDAIDPGCGNEIIETAAGESCEDGNTMDGDGCSSTCTLETAAQFSGTGGTVELSTLMNGFPGLVEVTVLEGQSITATTSDGAGGCPFDTQVILLNSDLNQLGAAFTAGCEGFGLPDQTFSSNLEAGTYFIAVFADDEANDGMLVTLEVIISDAECGNGFEETRGGEQCDDGGTANGDGCDSACQFEGNFTFETEPNNDSATANASGATAGNTVTLVGSIMPVDDDDYYQIDLAATGTLVVITYPDVGDPTSCDGKDTILTLYDNAGTELFENDDDSDRGGVCSKIDGTVETEAQNLAAGTYFIKVSGFSTRTFSNYFLQIEVQ